MNLTGGGAFYSQTPESCLEDLGVNKGVNKGSFSKGAGAKQLRILKGDVILNGVKNRRNEHKCLTQRFFEQSSQNDMRINVISEQSYSSEARVSSRLENETEINKKLASRTQGFENDEVCHSERSEESQSLANIVSKKILNYPTSTLPCNARPSQTRGAEVQDDVYGCHSEAKAEESQSRMQRIVCALTPTHSRMVLKPAFTLAEVLITLGIVGIIATMTLPMLAEKLDIKKAPWLELFNILIYFNLSSADCSCNVNT